MKMKKLYMGTIGVLLVAAMLACGSQPVTESESQAETVVETLESETEKMTAAESESVETETEKQSETKEASKEKTKETEKQSKKDSDKKKESKEKDKVADASKTQASKEKPSKTGNQGGKVSQQPQAPASQKPQQPQTQAPAVQEPQQPQTQAPATQEPQQPQTQAPVTQEPQQPQTQAPAVQEPQQPQTQAPETQAPHVHTWVVNVPAWDEEVYESHNFCNGCGADITGNEDHIFWCGPNGSGYHADRVQTGTIHHDATYICSGCGATK